MKKKASAEVPSGEKKYIIQFKDENKTELQSKVLILEELLQYEAEDASILVGGLDMNVLGKGDIIQNAFGLNTEMSRSRFNSKLCAIILHDDECKKYTEEFYSNCVAKDLAKPVADYFNAEGASMLNGLASVIFSPFIKKMEEQN